MPTTDLRLINAVTVDADDLVDALSALTIQYVFIFVQKITQK